MIGNWLNRIGNKHFPFLNRFWKRPLFIQTEQTPNDNALKFIITGKQLGHQGWKTLDFPTRTSALKSPLANKLFDIEGIDGVLISNDFITISKTEQSEWKYLKPFVFEILTQFITTPQSTSQSSDESKFEDTVLQFEPSEKDKEIVKFITELLNSRIRPSILQDGGDLQFVGFVDGIVQLKLQGSCKSCASSTITLKMGIERMLKYYVPEVIGVEQISNSMGEEEFEKLERKLSRKGMEDTIEKRSN